MDLGISGRTAVLTGGSGAIGRATAAALLTEGVRVVMVARNRNRLERARAAIEQELDAEGRADSAGGRLAALALDVTAPDAPARTLGEAQRQFGPVDILVNNAGTSALRPHDELSDAEWQAQWELHVMAPMRFARACAPLMADRGWGRIVTVSSSSGKRPSATNLAYSVTKAAALSLSRGYADLFAARGVLVNAVTPGPVAGELWLGPGGLADQQAAAQGRTREEVLRAVAQRTPVGRLGTPEQIAAVIAFLCSERAANVAGAAWSVDGGTVPGIL